MPATFAPATVDARRLPDGGWRLTSPQDLKPYPRNLIQCLRHWAAARPDHVFLAERAFAGGWIELSYRAAETRVRAVAQGLIDRGLTEKTPVAILSENGIDHALLQLACMQAGIPAAPLSPAYALMSRDFGRLNAIFSRMPARLIYAADGKRYGPALSALAAEDREIVVSDNILKKIPTTRFSTLCRSSPSDAVETRFQAVGPDRVAKILFTSGSTGIPKGVLNTHRMLCANQQSILQVWPFLKNRPPVVLDWLPWSHTFGGNQNFNLVLYNGGTLYIDNGRPVGEEIEKTVENLKTISPTLYFNVPRGFDALLPFLECDPALRDRFFSNLDLIFYAGAALPQHLWTRLETLCLQSRNTRLPLVSGWGATETAPMVTIGHFFSDRAGVIGLPGPGCVLKLVPDGDKMEMRVKGPNVTPGYWKDPIQTRNAFDENGFYRTGDAGALVDAHCPEKGIRFNGRIAEDFKLLTGTWVHVGSLRPTLIAACSPAVADAVITGHDADAVGALLFPNIEGCKTLCGSTPPAEVSDLLCTSPVRRRVLEGIRAHNARHPGSATRIARALFLTDPPDIDAGEITDKGYLNQQNILKNRAHAVNRLYRAGSEDPEVLIG
jgi:feruloyl-CoA synthase